MAMRGIGRWFKERRVFVIGIATVLVIILVVSGIVLGGSSRGKATSGGPPESSTSPGVPPAASPTAASTASPTAAAPTAASTASPTAAASDSISLKGWKLTLPVNAGGNLSGSAQELGVAAATSPWLTRNADGSLTFWAPAAGATTANSGHSRTELVSENGFSFGTGSHTLAATLEVSQVPALDPDIIIGQIHGNGAINSVPFVMVHWRDQSIVAVVKQAMSGSGSQTTTLLSGVPLNARFSFTITDDGNGALNLTATCAGRSNRVSVQVPAVFVGSDMRFQVGDYQQATAAASAADGGRVTFFAVAAS